MISQYDPEQELLTTMGALELLMVRARVLHHENKLMELSTVLNRIQRIALEGTYCICDIADMV